jgi:hypothetical protein
MIDAVIASGEPLEVERNGRIVVITARPAERKLEALVQRPEAITGDPEQFVHIDWSDEWRP